GAAWAPLGFLAADRCLRCRRRGALSCLALVLALQVLGGDPEAAYVTVVSASGYAVGLAAARAPSVMGRLLLRLAAGLVPVYLVLLALSWCRARAIHASALPAAGMSPPWWPPTGLLVGLAWGVAAALVVWRTRGGRDARGFGWMMGGLAGA